jgi:hypothetical protein
MKIRKSWMTCKNHGRKSLRRKRKELESILNRLQLKKRIKEFLTSQISMRILNLLEKFTIAF